MITRLDARLRELDRRLLSLSAPAPAPAVADAIARFQSDADALRFHWREASAVPPVVAILGGTGTGKSTVLNRLLQANLTATSFRRTFTAGPVAIAGKVDAVPAGWLGLPHQPIAPADLPARGSGSMLAVVTHASPVTAVVTLVDSPDLDGDHPEHHALADRIFRWAQAVVFLVTPEKYQMTELLPYYRLAQRYALPALFVMNKTQDRPAVEDYARQLADRGWSQATVWSIPRDDAAYEAPAGQDMAGLRSAIAMMKPAEGDARATALARRLADLVGRVRDQVVAPLRHRRQQVDELLPRLRALQLTAGAGAGAATGVVGAGGIDVSPLTQQLRRRMQEQSILYLMGPQRILQRIRQAPGLLLRLPRTLWDSLAHGKNLQVDLPAMEEGPDDVPDFPKMLADQFTIAQSRIDDLLRSSPSVAEWMDASPESRAQIRVDAAEARRIAEEELAGLKQWLEQRHGATPRDTRLVQMLLKYLPGGKKLVAWSEAAPYLLALVVAAHHAFFGPIDLLVIGGFSLATWLGEKLSNEVTARTRQANQAMMTRFDQLVRTQLDRSIAWLERQAPRAEALRAVERILDELEPSAGPA